MEHVIANLAQYKTLTLYITGAFTQAGQDNVTSASNFYLASVNGRRQLLTRRGILLRA